MTIDSTPASLQDIYEYLVRQRGVFEDDTWAKTLRSVGITGAISQGVSEIFHNKSLAMDD